MSLRFERDEKGRSGLAIFISNPHFLLQAPVVQRLDIFIYWINNYPADNMCCLECILYAGQRFIQGVKLSNF